MSDCEQDAAYIIKVLREGLNYRKIGATMIALMQWIEEDYWQAETWRECMECCDQLESLANDPDMQNVPDVDTTYVRGIAQMCRGAIHLGQGQDQERLKDAIDFFSNSRRLFQDANAPHSEAVALLALGIAYQRGYELDVYPKEHHWSETLKMLQRSLTLFRNLENRRQADVRDRLAEVWDLFKRDLGTREFPPSPKNPAGREPSKLPVLQFLPIISEIAAGKERPTSNDVTGYVATDMLKVEEQDFIVQMLRSKLKFRPEHHYFAVRVVGDSMVEADIAPGDYVILIKPSLSELSPHSGDIVAAVIADVDDKATLKRFLFRENRITLKPESPNPDHQASEFSLQEFQSRVRIAGVAVAVLKPRPS